MTVEGVKSWGVTGYVTVPDKEKAKAAFYRCAHENFLVIGRAGWEMAEATDDAE
jgi:hypothetical protein